MEIESPSTEEKKQDLAFNLDYITPDHKEKLEILLEEYKDVFASKDTELGRTNLPPSGIETGNNPPVKQKAYSGQLRFRPELERQLNDSLKANLIKPSSSA